MLILIDDFLNFVKIMKFLFEWLKKCLRGYLIYVILGYESILFFKFLFIDFKIIYIVNIYIYIYIYILFIVNIIICYSLIKMLKNYAI